MPRNFAGPGLTGSRAGLCGDWEKADEPAGRRGRRCYIKSFGSAAVTLKLVPHHSHWGAFLAEVEGDRLVGAQPFGRDPELSPMLAAIPAMAYSPLRIAQPM